MVSCPTSVRTLCAAAVLFFLAVASATKELESCLTLAREYNSECHLNPAIKDYEGKTLDSTKDEIHRLLAELKAARVPGDIACERRLSHGALGFSFLPRSGTRGRGRANCGGAGASSGAAPALTSALSFSLDRIWALEDDKGDNLTKKQLALQQDFKAPKNAFALALALVLNPPPAGREFFIPLRSASAAPEDHAQIPEEAFFAPAVDPSSAAGRAVAGLHAGFPRKAVAAAFAWGRCLDSRRRFWETRCPDVLWPGGRWDDSGRDRKESHAKGWAKMQTWIHVITEAKQIGQDLWVRRKRLGRLQAVLDAGQSELGSDSGHDLSAFALLDCSSTSEEEGDESPEEEDSVAMDSMAAATARVSSTTTHDDMEMLRQALRLLRQEQDEGQVEGEAGGRAAVQEAEQVLALVRSGEEAIPAGNANSRRQNKLKKMQRKLASELQRSLELGAEKEVEAGEQLVQQALSNLDLNPKSVALVEGVLQRIDKNKALAGVDPQMRIDRLEGRALLDALAQKKQEHGGKGWEEMGREAYRKRAYDQGARKITKEEEQQRYEI